MFKKFLNRKAKIVESTDPDKIYVENIRSFFGITTRMAKYLCEVAVRNGVFKKYYGVECKSCSRIIERFESKECIPNKINCVICEYEGKDNFVFNKEELEIIVFYQYMGKDGN